jgi:peptidoglycan/xylan/chitin deacetylase (PgdA/CDA1 family)
LTLKTAGIITTVIVFIAGLAMISPLFFRTGKVSPEKVILEQIQLEQIEPEQAEPEQLKPEDNAPAQKEPEQDKAAKRIMLNFSVYQSADVTEWCEKLSSILNAYDIGANVFIVGKVAEQYPRCVLCFNEKVDIGSMTYNYVNLTDISNYILKFLEIEKGKTAVDTAGNLISCIFMAPYGATDENIYSLLWRSSILADYSYINQYNLYKDGQFIKYDAAIYASRDYAPDFFLTLPEADTPVIINFDNSYPISSLEAFIAKLVEGGVELINASDLVGFALTIR